MNNQSLEKLLNDVCFIGITQDSYGASIDVYTGGLTEMECRHNFSNVPCPACMGISGGPPEGPPMHPFFGRDSPGQFVTGSYNGLIERVDASDHGGSDLHLNYDIYGFKKKQTLRGLGDNHHIDL